MLELRKDFIVKNIVFMTNVFSYVGVNSWNLFTFWSLCGSRLMNHQATFAVGRGRKSDRDLFNIEGLWATTRSFLEDFEAFVFNFFLEGASPEVSLSFLFLAPASACLVLFSSEAAEGTFGFEPVMLAGKTMLGRSCR